MSDAAGTSPQGRPFYAVLMAGGASARMGTDKAGLMLKGRPLWRRQLETLRELDPHRIYISGRADGPYAAAGVEIIPDMETGKGPLLGLMTALCRATREDEWALILAVDMPQMPAQYLRMLVEAAISRQKGQVPHDGQRFEPLAAVYSRACFRLAARFFQEGWFSMQEFVRAGEAEGLLERRPIGFGETFYFVNVNTPDQARAAGLDFPSGR